MAHGDLSLTAPIHGHHDMANLMGKRIEHDLRDFADVEVGAPDLGFQLRLQH
jgi:hypothetical protein